MRRQLSAPQFGVASIVCGGAAFATFLLPFWLDDVGNVDLLLVWWASPVAAGTGSVSGIKAIRSDAKLLRWLGVTTCVIGVAPLAFVVVHLILFPGPLITLFLGLILG